MDCLFCKIANHEIPSTTVYEDDQVIAFQDIDPKAPFHVLVVPKKHISSVLEVEDMDKDLMYHIVTVIQKIAKESGIDQSGFRVVVNTGEDGGQSVQHLHFHVLGKRLLNWPPG